MGSALPAAVPLSASVRTVFVPESALMDAPPAAVKGTGLALAVTDLYRRSRGVLGGEIIHPFPQSVIRTWIFSPWTINHSTAIKCYSYISICTV